MIDLHIHTTASDGAHTPSETVKIAAESGMDTIAITDHDTMDGVSEAVETAKAFDLRVIPGAEFSAEHNTGIENSALPSGYDGEVHILAYNVKPNDALHQHFDWLIQTRHDKIALFIQKLNERGVNINASDLPAPSGKIVGRVGLARALVNKKYAKSIQAAFEKYLVPGCPTYVSGKKASWENVLRLINASGGVSVLAHPMFLRLDDDKFERFLKNMVNNGLNGIEAFYPSHPRNRSKYYYSLAKKFCLIATGGSDFHGISVRNIPMGQGLADYQSEITEGVNAIMNFI